MNLVTDTNVLRASLETKHIELGARRTQRPRNAVSNPNLVWEYVKSKCILPKQYREIVTLPSGASGYAWELYGTHEDFMSKLVSPEDILTGLTQQGYTITRAAILKWLHDFTHIHGKMEHLLIFKSFYRNGKTGVYRGYYFIGTPYDRYN